MTTRASGEMPDGRTTGAITAVEVSLCAQAYTSTPSSATATGREPGSDLITDGADSHGAAAAADANFAENSPNDRCWLLCSIRPKVAMSQNAVAPPLPSTTS